MIKFNTKFMVGTKVLISGFSDFFTIKSIHKTRKWVEVCGLHGFFQRKDIVKFSNK